MNDLDFNNLIRAVGILFVGILGLGVINRIQNGLYATESVGILFGIMMGFGGAGVVMILSKKGDYVK